MTSSFNENGHVQRPSSQAAPKERSFHTTAINNSIAKFRSKNTPEEMPACEPQRHAAGVPGTDMATIEGRLLYFRFRSDAPGEDGTHHAIAVVASRDGEKVAIKGDVVNLDELTQGRHYRFTGVWTEWKDERQLAFVLHQEISAVDDLSIAEYLHRMGGLTEKRALKLARLLGPDAADKIVADPDGVATATKIKPEVMRAAAERLAVLTVRVSLNAIELHGLLRRYANRLKRRTLAEILRRYRADAVRTVRDEPFRLILDGIEGVTFDTADKIYLGEGGPERESDPIRGAFRLWHEMHNDRDGSTVYPTDQAVEGLSGLYPEFPAEVAIRLAEQNNLVTLWQLPDGMDVISTRARHRQERLIAEAIGNAAGIKGEWPVGPFEGLRASQAKALEGLPVYGRIVALLGPPGTGKTTTAAAVAKRAVQLWGHGAVAGCALAAKAALRFGQCLKKAGVLGVQAMTIHGLLEAVPGPGGFTFRRERSNPLQQALVFVDEVSMVDVSLFARLLDAIDFHRTRLFLLGDLGQLAPVGAGAPLRDMVAKGVIKVLELTEIVRNSGLITSACSAIKSGQAFVPARRYDHRLDEAPVGNPTNVVHYPIDFAKGNLADEIERVYMEEIAVRIGIRFGPRIDLLSDGQVIIGTNPVRHALNKRLQHRLNPKGEQLLKSKFRRGDKVINLKNVKLPAVPGGPATVFISNGDLGLVESIDQVKRRLTVSFPGGRTVIVPVGEVKGDVYSGTDDMGEDAVKTGCTLDLGYAITGHKSQGSEWPHVIVGISPKTGVGCREWWYTAISRASRCVHVVGSLNELWQQCQTQGLAARRTGLPHMIGGRL